MEGVRRGSFGEDEDLADKMGATFFNKGKAGDASLRNSEVVPNKSRNETKDNILIES